MAPKTESKNPFLHSGLPMFLKLWPLAFVPLTIFAVQKFGHEAANILLGVLFLGLFVWKADLPLRRLMIVLAVFSGLFETANVASGAYTYFDSLASPLWISLGWAILGWWFMQLKDEAAKISNNSAFAFTLIILVAVSFFNHTLSLSTPIALAGLYALSLAVRQPFALYAFASIFALIAEFSGTYAGIWGYFNVNNQPVPPDLAMLALAYPTILAFSIWISGFENQPKKQ